MIDIRALIFHMNIFIDKIFLLAQKFVFVTLAIFGVCHYRRHLCSTTTFWFFYLHRIYIVYIMYEQYEKDKQDVI